LTAAGFEKAGAVLNRRSFLLGGAAVTAVASVTFSVSAMAQTAEMAKRWGEYRSIIAEARRLGLATPRIGSGPEALDDAEAIIVFSDLVEMLERSATMDNKMGPQTDALIERASELLRATMAKAK